MLGSGYLPAYHLKKTESSSNCWIPRIIPGRPFLITQGTFWVPLGWGPLHNQPHIHLVIVGILLGPNPLLKGSLALGGG